MTTELSRIFDLAERWAQRLRGGKRWRSASSAGPGLSLTTGCAGPAGALRASDLGPAELVQFA